MKRAFANATWMRDCFVVFVARGRMSVRRGLRSWLVIVVLFACVSTASAQDTAAKLDEYVRALVNLGQFSGAVLVAREGKPILSHGYGRANGEWQVANESTKNFALGPSRNRKADATVNAEYITISTQNDNLLCQVQDQSLVIFPESDTCCMPFVERRGRRRSGMSAYPTSERDARHDRPHGRAVHYITVDGVRGPKQSTGPSKCRR